MKAAPRRTSKTPPRIGLRSSICNNRGQALAETGIAMAFLLLPVTIGIAEIARGFLVVNMITHAARDGARAAAVANGTNRNHDGTIKNTAEFERIVRNDIGHVLGPDDGHFDVQVTQRTIEEIPMVQVRVVGSFDPIFWPNAFRVDRVITFRDEGRRDELGP